MARTTTAPAPRPVGVAAWPLVNGHIGWTLASNHGTRKGQLPRTGDELSLSRQAVAAIKAAAPPGTNLFRLRGIREAFFTRHLNENTKAPADIVRDAERLAEAAFQLLPVSERLAIPRLYWTEVPASLNHFQVATDASVVNGKAAWAYVTGAGWYGTGKLSTPSTSIAEWVALCEGLRLFPDGSQVKIMADNQGVCDVIKDIIQGHARPKPNWLPQGAYQAGLQLLRLHRVSLKQIPRNSHPLHAKADELCGQVSRGTAKPTALSPTSQQDMRQHLK